MTPFKVEYLRNRPIHIIGQGALGGPLAEHCFRKGVPELHIWDFDTVEARNRFNQRVFAEDIGHPKVRVRARILQEIYPESETVLVLHNERLAQGAALAGIVLCAVDWNRLRYEEVWPCVKDNPDVSFFADGRVGIDGGKAFGLDPNNPYHVLRYEDPLHRHPDPENAEANAACKSEFPMPENADAVAAEVSWLLTRWLLFEQGFQGEYDNFVGWQYLPHKVVLTEQWDSDSIRQMVTTIIPMAEDE